MSLRNLASQGVLLMLLSSSVYFVFSFGSGIILPRLLLPVDYGIYFSAQAFVSYFAFASDPGITPAAIQAKDLDRTTFSTAFTIRAVASLASFGAIVALSPLVSRYFGNPEVGLASIAMAIPFLVGALYFPQVVTVNRRLNFRLLFVLSVVSSASSFAIAVPLAVFDYAFWSLVLAAIGSTVVATIVAIAAVRSRPSLGFDRRAGGDLWRFGRNLAAASLFGDTITIGVGRFVIGGLLGLAGLGFYAVAFALSGIVSTAVSVIDQVFFPVFSRLNGELGSIRGAAISVIEYASWFAFPVVIGLEALGPELVFLVLGHGTYKWASSVLPFQILLVAQILSVVSLPLIDAFKAMGKTHFLSTASILSALVYLPVLYFSTLEFQLEGAALALLVAGAVVLTAYLRYGRSALGIGVSDILRVTVKPLVSSLLCYPVVVALYGKVGVGYLGLFNQGLIGLACYIVVMTVWTRGAFLSKSWMIFKSATRR